MDEFFIIDDFLDGNLYDRAIFSTLIKLPSSTLLTFADKPLALTEPNFGTSV